MRSPRQPGWLFALALALAGYLGCEFVRSPVGQYACTRPDDCGSEEACYSGLCAPARSCERDQECRAGERCLAGICAEGSSCDANNVDPPDDDFLDSDCDGIDGKAAAALFVDPSSGDDTNPGTRESPHKSIGAAIARASLRGLHHVYLAQGTYPESVNLTVPVSLFGGYLADAGWARRAGVLARVRGGGVALRISVPSLVTVERLEISSAAASVAGQPSVGIHVVDSAGQVRLRWLQVVSGDGANGLDGADGGLAMNGPDAGRAGPSGTIWDDDGGSSPLSTGGAGGINWGCGASAGGSGGAPATAGHRSLRRTDGGEGAALLACDCGGLGCMPVSDAGPPRMSPEPGHPGAISPKGSDGDGGDGVGNRDELWAPAGGTAGGQGVSGPGGGGGGGGLSTLVVCGPVRRYVFGGGGGGGGAGGCGGLGGLGGGGGGASIGLYLHQSQVMLENLSVATGNGGSGGHGGTGAPGFAGLPGGGGGNPSSTGPGQYGPGAAGGPGGWGGSGGHGGNGGGGPSVGVFCVGGTVNLTSVYVDAGLGGRGGMGPAAPGPSGIRCAFHGCPVLACP